MAIACTDVPVRFFGFCRNCTSADISGCETILAAPGAGLSIVVNHITINSTANITISIGEGETVPGTLDTVFIGPVNFPAVSSMQWDFGNGGLLGTFIFQIAQNLGSRTKG